MTRKVENKDGRLHIDLTDKQVRAYSYLTDENTRYIFYGGAGGGGKGWLGCVWVWTQMMSYDEVRYFIGRKELKRLRETTLKTFWKVVSYYGRSMGMDFRNDLNMNENRGIITHKKTGSELLLIELADKPSDPDFDDLGSLEFTGGFVDEAPEISAGAYDAIKTRIGRQNNELHNIPPKLLLAGNPSKGWVYTDFYKPHRYGSLPRDHAFVQALPGDNRFLPREYIKLLSDMPENSPRKQRILYGNWEYDDDPTVMIEQDKIQDLFTNSFVRGGRKYITADIARKGRDLTCIGVWDEWRLVKVKTIPRNDLKQAVEAIEELRNRYNVPKSNVLVDSDGVGGGVVDFGRYKGFVAQKRPVPMGGKKQNFNHIKSQCYFYLADKVNESDMFIDKSGVTRDDEARITLELEILRRGDADVDGKMKIESKDKMKERLGGKSPDYADMLMMRSWFDIKPKKFVV